MAGPSEGFNKHAALTAIDSIRRDIPDLSRGEKAILGRTEAVVVGASPALDACDAISLSSLSAHMVKGHPDQKGNVAEMNKAISGKVTGSPMKCKPE